MGQKLKVKASHALILLVVFHLIGNTVWIILNNAPPRWDEAAHTTRALSYSRFFTGVVEGNPNFDNFLKPFSDAYAPLAQIFTGIFLLGTIVAVYYLGKSIFNNSWTAFLEAFIFSFFQIIYDNSRWLLLDIPLIFFIVLNYLLLTKSNYFSDKKFTFLFAFSVALVALTKIQGLIYLVAPFLLVAIRAYKTKRSIAVKQLILGAVFGSILILPWIIASFENLTRYYQVVSLGEPLADPRNLLDTATWGYYLKLFINNTYSLIFFLPLLVISMIFTKRREYTQLVLANLAFIYILFTLFPNKDLRYIFPIFPLVALIFAQSIFNLSQKYKKFGFSFIAFFIVLNILIYLILSWGIPIKKGYVEYVVLPVFKDLNIINLSDYPVRKFSNNKWPYELILKDLSRYSKGEPLNFVFMPNYDHFNDNTFNLYREILGLDNLHVVRADGKYEFESEAELERFIAKYQYFLYTPDEVSVFYAPDKKAFEEMQSKIRELLEIDQATVLTKYQLPEGQDIWLVEKKVNTPSCSISYDQDFNSVTFSVNWSKGFSDSEYPFDFGADSFPDVLTGESGEKVLPHDYAFYLGETKAYEAGFLLEGSGGKTNCMVSVTIA